jgi:uncharacterized repeat protein (TIGR03803 family)
MVTFPTVGSYAIACLAIGLSAGAAHAASEKVLYQFNCNAVVGCSPAAGLVAAGGTLYGTTNKGVFKASSSGVVQLLHRWGAPPDGSEAEAAMINVGGALYGTTNAGGKNFFGTVFKITPSGAESVLYSFNKTQGRFPSAGLVDVGGGVLYGTTSSSGGTGFGDVFKVTTAGVGTEVYKFKGRPRDGSGPLATLIDVKGTLYGTTSTGGQYGQGTVFKITTSGVEAVLHAFHNVPDKTDGTTPAAGLLAVGASLYGTTVGGGVQNCGTVFRMTLTGVETPLYSFNCTNGDGGGPAAALIDVGGTLYGTTQGGGKYGQGTVFSITPAGAYKVLYSFKGGRDGAVPQGGVVALGGALYGVTGDTNNGNKSTLYKIIP